jgi:hypothetical protein
MGAICSCKTFVSLSTQCYSSKGHSQIYHHHENLKTYPLSLLDKSFSYRLQKISLPSIAYRAAQGPTQPPVQWVLGAFSPGWPLPSGAEVHPHGDAQLIKHSDFTITLMIASYIIYLCCFDCKLTCVDDRDEWAGKDAEANTVQFEVIQAHMERLMKVTKTWQSVLWPRFELHVRHVAALMPYTETWPVYATKNEESSANLQVCELLSE